MRIGIVTGEYPPMQGGIGAYTHILATEMQQQGAAPFIFASRQSKTVDPLIPVTHQVTTWNLAAIRSVHTWAMQQRIDILNLQFQTAAFGMSPFIHLLPYCTSIPVVTTFHDLRHPYLFPKAGRLRDWVVMHLARSSDGVIVTNQEDFERLQMVHHKKLIPIGSNIAQELDADFAVGDWRTKAKAEPADFLIAYFGLFNQTKGIEVLLESIARLRSNGIPVKLAMVGGGLGSSDPTNARFHDQMQTVIGQLGIASVIHWTGYLENEQEVGAYLAAADVVALPFNDGASYRRGSLMAAIEYGSAIVTTRPTISIPAFKDNINMLLIPPGDTSALSAALQRLWDSPALRDQLRAGASQLRQLFNWTSICRETLSFFEQVRTHSV